MDFTLKIYIATESTSSINWVGEAYYTASHYDNVEISDGVICISGHRSSPFDLKKILFNNTSTLYSQIAKTLAFYYLCTGASMTITKMELSSDINSIESETDFLQPFKRILEPWQIMSPNDLQNIFMFHGKEQLFLTCVICYINAIQNDSFEQYWKSFNSIYNIIETNGKDFDKLCAIRRFIEINRSKFTNTLNFIAPDRTEDIRKLRIREFILNDWPTERHTQAYADAIHRFSDIRIIEIFEATLPYRIDFLRNKSLDVGVQNHITHCKTQNKTNNVELLCFYVLKYSYFIRNKYFHAEKATPYFILKETAEINELSKISEIFKHMIADFLRCNNLYIP